MTGMTLGQVLRPSSAALSDRGRRGQQSDRVPSPPNWTKTGTVPSQGPVRFPGTVPSFHGRWHLTPKAQLRLTKYLSLFVRKYWRMCLQPCRDLCLRLNPALCLDLGRNSYLNLNPSPFRTLYAKSFQWLFHKSFASSFGSLFVLKYQQLWVPLCVASSRQMLPPRQ